MSDSLQSLFSRCDSVLVFDTETSGLSWQRDEIIEFSAIRLTASGTEEVDEFIRCTRSLPPRIVELTGITDELLRQRLEATGDGEFPWRLPSARPAGIITFDALKIRDTLHHEAIMKSS